MQDKIFQVAHLADQGVLYLLLTLCIMSLLMIVNRYFTLNKTFSACLKVKSEVEKAINNLSELEKNNLSTNSLLLLPYHYLSLGSHHIQENGLEGLDSLTESFKNIYKSKLEKFLSFLATVGSNSPYIGLFGTVLGIMKSFNDMSAQAGQAGNNSVMAGISSALIATAAGLLAAIPAVLAYNYFQKQVKYIFETIDLLQTYLILTKKRTGHGK